jgi:hypothetical protein
MKAALLARLARMENRPEMIEPAAMRYGWVKPLPKRGARQRNGRSLARRD